MRVRILQPCAFWDAANGRIELTPGDEFVELADEHAQVAVREHWATTEDVASGAPPREKAAARKAPEKK
jgi:hypothetical protein